MTPVRSGGNKNTHTRILHTGTSTHTRETLTRSHTYFLSLTHTHSSFLFHSHTYIYIQHSEITVDLFISLKREIAVLRGLLVTRALSYCWKFKVTLVVLCCVVLCCVVLRSSVLLYLSALHIQCLCHGGLLVC